MKDHPAHAYLRYRYELILSAVQRAFKGAEADGDLVGGVSLPKTAQLYAALSDGLQLQHRYGVGQVGQTALCSILGQPPHSTDRRLDTALDGM